MFAAPVTAWYLTPTMSIAVLEPQIDLETAIPKNFANWRMAEHQSSIIPTAEQEKTLDAIYSQIVSRSYVNDQGQSVMLSVAYGSSQSKQLRAHRQEVCYAAQGFKIEGLRSVELKIDGVLLPATRMRAIQGSRSEPVTYWFTMGDKVVGSYLERELTQFRYALSGYLPDGYLFRVSSISRDAQASYDLHLQFAKDILAHTDRKLAGKLLGATR
jgi:EpsI family protein